MAGSSAKDTVLKMGDTSPATTAVAELKTIDGPNVEVARIDASTFDSPSNYREYVAGMLDGGEVSFTGNATSASHTALRAELGNADKYWRITFPCDSDVIADFQGPLTNLSINATYDGLVEISGTIAIDGAVSWS